MDGLCQWKDQGSSPLVSPMTFDSGTLSFSHCFRFLPPNREVHIPKYLNTVSGQGAGGVTVELQITLLISFIINPISHSPHCII